MPLGQLGGTHRNQEAARSKVQPMIGTGTMKKLGYCKQCLRNVPHMLLYHWPGFRLLNFFPWLSEKSPVASWNCCACEKHTYVLRRPLEEAAHDVTSTDMSDVRPFRKPRPNNRTGLLFRRKRKGAETEEVHRDEPHDPPADKVGNFLRSEESLIMQHSRASRYTQKFRDGVVDRIIEGKATITQVRKELNVTERDILDWLNRRIHLKDQKIAKLTQVLKTVRTLTLETEGQSNEDAPPRPQSESHIRIYGDGEQTKKLPTVRPAKDTVDGSINKKT